VLSLTGDLRGVRSAIDKKIQDNQKRHGKEYHHKLHLLLGAFLVLGKKVFFRIVGQGKSPSLRFLVAIL
jgi:hypothetical protein